MRELTRIEKRKTKRVIQFTNLEDFKKGEWLKELPSSDKLEISFKANNCILIVNDTPDLKIKSVKEYIDKGDEHERE